MVLQSIIFLTFLMYQTAHGLVVPAAPIVFWQVGQNVTIHSRLKEKTLYFTDISWYRLSMSGKVDHLVSFNRYSLNSGRYNGALPEDLELHLKISRGTISDSGLNFAVLLSDKSFKLGSSSVMALTDPEALPIMRVLLSRSGAVLCELKGGGPDWSDPQWETYDGEEGPKLLQPKAETFVDEHGALIRSSILSLEDGIRGLNCICQHNSGVIIRTRVMQEGKDQCQLLLYLSPLAAVLLLVTLTASGLWARRRGKQRPVTQGMDLTDRT